MLQILCCTDGLCWSMQWKANVSNSSDNVCESQSTLEVNVWPNPFTKVGSHGNSHCAQCDQGTWPSCDVHMVSCMHTRYHHMNQVLMQETPQNPNFQGNIESVSNKVLARISLSSSYHARRTTDYKAKTRAVNHYCGPSEQPILFSHVCAATDDQHWRSARRPWNAPACTGRTSWKQVHIENSLYICPTPPSTICTTHQDRLFSPTV